MSYQTDNSSPDALSYFLDLTKTFATPFAEKLAYGGKPSTEAALVAERNRINKLNGSGPNDPNLAQRSASGDTTGWGVGDLFSSFGGFFTPKDADPKARTAIGLAVVVVIGILIWKLVKR